MKKIVFAALFLSLLFACTGDASPAPPMGPIPTDEPPLIDPGILAELPIDHRSFRMGTAGFVPRNYPDSSPEDWQSFLSQEVALYGEVFGVHVNAGEKTNDTGVLEQVQLAYEQAQGVEVYVALAVNHEEGPFTPQRGEQLIQAAVAVARKYEPGIISLGVESNSLFLFQPDTFDLYVEYARKAYDEIKRVSPDTMVMNNFQLERMKGASSLAGEDFEPHWTLIQRFEGKIDLISFTVYPFLEYATAAEIPPDYLAEIREHTELPIMITETGWPSEDTASGVIGSDREQVTYLLKLVRQANSIDIATIIWVFPHDSDFGIAGGIFDRISLRTNGGNPKPAYAYWQAVKSLPFRD
jgi:hypothetical protein